MLGSMARYYSGAQFLHSFPTARFPWGTFFVNLLGCLLIGVIAGITERLTDYNAELRLLAITGFLGGFTTFSAFGLETLHLLRDQMPGVALIYAVGSVLFGVVLAYLGLRLAQ